MSTTRRTLLAGLAALPIAPVSTAGAAMRDADPLPALYAEALRVTAILNSDNPAEAEAEALMDRSGACCDVATSARATTPAGAVASLEWAKGELLQFGFNIPEPGGDPDKQARFVLALLDSSLGVLRIMGGSA